MNDRLDDRRLVKRLLAQDVAAFNEFFDDYFPRLYRFARTRLGDDSDAAKEVVQCTLTKAIRKLHTYRAEAALFTWLCMICRREIATWYRRHAKERARLVLTEDFPDVRAAVESFPAAESSDPERNFQRLELVRLIAVALDSLPAKYGNALEWRYIEGYSVKEIAERLDLGLQATYSMLARARRAFHDVYSALTGPVVDGDSGESPLFEK